MATSVGDLRGLVHHSDQVSQYISLASSGGGIAGSMGRVGDTLDNAAAESLFPTIE